MNVTVFRKPHAGLGNALICGGFERRGVERHVVFPAGFGLLALAGKIRRNAKKCRIEKSPRKGAETSFFQRREAHGRVLEKNTVFVA